MWKLISIKSYLKINKKSFAKANVHVIARRDYSIKQKQNVHIITYLHDADFDKPYYVTHEWERWSWYNGRKNELGTR